MHAERETTSAPKKKRYPRYVDRPSALIDRGYACVALDRPTDPVNVGHALRASFCFRARLMIIGGSEEGLRLGKLSTDPMRTYRHVPVIKSENILDSVPYGCSLVCIELDPRATPLMEFTHPERACYVFGPENGSISDDLLERSEHKIEIPTVASLNLGMTVNIVLYDRIAKAWDRTLARRARFQAYNTSSDYRNGS